MFNTTNISIKRECKSVMIIPEKIDLNMRLSENDSFFETINRNSNNYTRLMGINPCLRKTKFKAFEHKCGIWHIDRMNEMMGGEYVDIDYPVKVLAIQYAGNDNFIFELIKL